MDAERGALKRGKYTSVIDRWQNDEVYRVSQLAHQKTVAQIQLDIGPMTERTSQLVQGWTEEYVKYLDYISKIDISHDARYNQRIRS